MAEYRWFTKVLVGPWFNTRKEAMCNAVGNGQAFINSGKGEIIVMRNYASIQQRKRVG